MRTPPTLFRVYGSKSACTSRNVRERARSRLRMGVRGMIFLTYVINEPRAVSCAVHMGGCAPPSHSVPRSPLGHQLLFARASIVRAIPPARSAHGGISCAHNRASLTNNPLDGSLRGAGRSVFKIRISWHDARNPHANERAI